MKIRLKKRGFWGVKRIELVGKIEKVDMRENQENPDKKHMAVFLKGLEGLGVVMLTHREAEMIAGKVSLKIGKVLPVVKKPIVEKIVTKKKAKRK